MTNFMNVRSYFQAGLKLWTVLIIAITVSMPASAISTVAKQALIIDSETGTILFSKAPDEAMAPSSMTKIMTAMIVFDHIATGKISLQQRFKISKKSWAKGGSKMFLSEGTFVEVDKLLKGLIVQSGNDASIAIAEGIAGSEDDFVKLMNQRAKDLGMNTTNFENASGWPDDNHYTTARDLVTLSQALITNYPDFYHYFSIPSFKYSDIFQNNRNPLLKKKEFGADGIKTGFTSAGGYGVTGSALLNGRRTIMVLNGMPSKSSRISESEKMMDWAQRNFDNYSLFKSGQVVDYGHVWLGVRKRVPLVVSNELRVTMPVGARSNLKAKIMYNGPIPAPILVGQRVGDLQLSAPGITPITIPLIAGEEVPKLGRLGAVASGLRYTLFGEDL